MANHIDAESFISKKYSNEEIPADVKQILIECSFDTEVSLLGIDISTIAEIECYINENRQILQNTSYESVNSFKFKPGHRILLLNLSEQIKLKESAESEKLLQPKACEFSYILKKFIESAETDFGRQPNGCR